MPPKLGIGTAQFGIPYGNKSDLPLISNLEVNEILKFSIQSNVTFFDTSPSYGKAEERLGSFPFPGGIEISTKLPATTKDIYSDKQRFKAFVQNSIEKSSVLLNQKKLGLLQLHQSDLSFLTSSVVKETLKEILEKKWVGSLGASVYDPEEAFAAGEIPGVSSIQFPLNLLDRRFCNLKVLHQLKGKRLIARSIFLQGLLVAKAAIPSLDSCPELKQIKEEALLIANESRMSLEEIALNFALNGTKAIDTVLLGVDSLNSLKENIHLASKLKNQNYIEKFSELSNRVVAMGLHDPRNWKNYRTLKTG